MQTPRQREGKLGEDIAESYLKQKGYQIVVRNFRCHFGEIDLITSFKNSLVLVEVKTRKNLKFGEPYEAVGWRKIRSILSTGQYYQKFHPQLPESLQIDVISILLRDNGKVLKLEHLSNVTA